MTKTLKIYCRHKDTVKQVKQVKLDLDARSYEEAIRKLIQMFREKETEAKVRFV